MDSGTTFISKAGLQRFYARIYEVFANKNHTHVGTNIDAATTTVRGTVQPDGTTIDVTAAGVISAKTATGSAKGIVQPDGTSININNGTISVPDASTSQKGLLSSSDKTKLNGVATGATKTEVTNATTLTITDSAGSTSTFSGMTAAERSKLSGIADNANNYSLPTASSDTLGGIKVGNHLSIINGVLTIADTVALVSALSNYVTTTTFNNFKTDDYDVFKLARETNFGEDIGDGLAVSPSKKLVIDTNFLGDYISEQFTPGVVVPTYNSKTGQYTGIPEWLASTLEEDEHKDEIYTTRIPKWDTSHDVVCVKTDDNAGLSVTPSTETYAGADDYKNLPAFKTWEVNGGYSGTGIPYVTAFKGRDSWFSRTGENGDVWIMTRVLWYKWEEDEDYQYISISASPQTGFIPEPGAVLANGQLRPFILRAKYPIGTYNGKIASVSGVMTRVRDISYNTLITLTAAKGAAYGSLSVDDLWYFKTMILIKYATKSSQTAFPGCTNHYLTYYPVIAETNVTHVTLSAANAANIPVGSTICIGTSDRGGQIINNAKVISKETTADGVALNLNTTTPFSTLTTHRVDTLPWYCGSCDEVLGNDGSPTGDMNGKEPFILQGIEYMVGAWEISTDIMFNWIDGEGHILVGKDRSTKVSGNSTGFVDTGLKVGQGSNDGWVYPTDFTHLDGLIITTNTGASQTTGVGDGNYTYKTGTTQTGLREFLAFGSLNYGGLAGASCFVSDSGLSVAGWDIGGRLSGTDTYGTWSNS